MQVQRAIGRRLREARQAANLTQERAAAEAGIDYKRYQRLEQGIVNPTLRTLVRLAAALRVDFWDLVRDSEEAPGASFAEPIAVREDGGASVARFDVTVTRHLPAPIEEVGEAIREAGSPDPSDLDRVAGLRSLPPGETSLRIRHFELRIVSHPEGGTLVSLRQEALPTAAEAEARRLLLFRYLDALHARLRPPA